jgi:hypothetical protein
MKKHEVKRLVLHGDRNVVLFQAEGDGEMGIELYGSTVEKRHAAVTLDRDEMRRIRDFIDRELKRSPRLLK